MRPHITCHMVTSIDGKVTGEFLYQPECEKATELYYELNRRIPSDGFICGRITMEESFTKGFYPDVSNFEPINEKNDFIPENVQRSGRYAVSFDTTGKLGWQSSHIIDDDPGYGGAQIIQVLSEQTDPRYLSYLQSLNIPYIFAGENAINISLALNKLTEYFGISHLLLEGGSAINGAFLQADVVDELSLVAAPVIAGAESKPLFENSKIKHFHLIRTETHDSALWLNFEVQNG